MYRVVTDNYLHFFRLLDDVIGAENGLLRTDCQISQTKRSQLGKRFDYIGTEILYPGPSMTSCNVAASTILSGTEAMHDGEVKEVFVTLKAPTPFKLFEDENAVQLLFLDVLLTRRSNGELCTTVHRKSTNTVQKLNSLSNHPMAHLPGSTRAVFRKVKIRCSDECEIDNIFETN
ncbi:unnamed protein product [Dibothriocephalus latus]|uniref:Uncharacterized protein n=1 Tax=Dibothriocephalus latus TaxID=60516 RepID=A0A3P7NC70_DIBLA|nr:unnamed protein product [Dibothriocephalus latus]